MEGVVKRISKDIAELRESTPEGIMLIVNENNIMDVQAWIMGAEGTPYQNGVFRVKLEIPLDFPRSPPKGYFITKIYHPNVSEQGEICVDALKKGWTQKMGLRHVLLVIRCLMIHPNAESALNQEAGKALIENYSEYFSQAAIYTKVHAMAQRDVQVLLKQGLQVSDNCTLGSYRGKRLNEFEDQRKRKRIQRL